jgi:hypothetical protein
VREWNDVAAEARRSKVDVHMGRLFGIMVEKAAELPEGDPRRKYKYRVVFQGNQVVTQNWEAAVFQNLGSSPSNMEAGKAVGCYGCVVGHDIEQADAEQAYIQADIEGTTTWVALPPEAWPESWYVGKGDKRKPRYQRPVVLLKKALYWAPGFRDILGEALQQGGDQGRFQGDSQLAVLFLPRPAEVVPGCICGRLQDVGPPCQFVGRVEIVKDVLES